MEVLKVDIFSNFFWFWGMIFCEALATIWLYDFLVTLLSGKGQIAMCRSRLLQENCFKVGFQNMFPNLTVARGNFTCP